MKEIIITTAIETAKGLVGTKEDAGANRGRVVDEIEQKFGFLGQPYCMLFVLYCYWLPYYNFTELFPLLKTASSQTFFEWAKKLGYVYTDPTLIQPGDIIIFRKWNLWSGHTGIILKYNDNHTISTIEGNTSNSDFGSQSDGDGIYYRTRNANTLNFNVSGFWIRGFINVRLIN